MSRSKAKSTSAEAQARHFFDAIHPKGYGQLELSYESLALNRAASRKNGHPITVRQSDLRYVKVATGMSMWVWLQERIPETVKKQRQIFPRNMGRCRFPSL